ncbi:MULTISPECIES: hypothetical protein [unclassified Cryobacterium]|uniref:hypothetical protein n=1 Tax=unclassified Cryobacterium TaxID=2649013 RepID=UPI000CE4AC19|nr:MULTISPECIES: hypothetical protein [unclassified Cryobacterium]
MMRGPGPLPDSDRPSLALIGWFLAVVLALIGPLALIGARRFPGPVVAVVAAAAVHSPSCVPTSACPMLP